MVTARTGRAWRLATPAIVAARPAWSGDSGTSNSFPRTRHPSPIAGGARTRPFDLASARATMTSTTTKTAPAPTRVGRAFATIRRYLLRAVLARLLCWPGVPPDSPACRAMPLTQVGWVWLSWSEVVRRRVEDGGLVVAEP